MGPFARYELEKRCGRVVLVYVEAWIATSFGCIDFGIRTYDPEIRNALSWHAAAVQASR